MTLTEEQWESLRCESCGKTLNEIRGSKYAGDYCLGEIRLDPGQGASRSDPPIESSYYFWCDECKNDSSEHFSDATKMIGFDMEKARASIAHYRIENPSNVDTESALKELVDQANLAEDALAEIERLQGFETAARDLNNDLIRIAGERDELAARIQELEDAHKRSGVKYAKIINELRSSVYANIPGLKKQWDEILNAPANGKIGPDARPKCDHEWQAAIEERGYQTCLKCGECRDIKDIPRTAPTWQIMDERKAALWHAIKVLKENDIMEEPEEHLWDEVVTVLQAMMKEVE